MAFAHSLYCHSAKVPPALMESEATAADAYDMSNDPRQRPTSYDPALLPVIMLCNPWQLMLISVVSEQLDGF